VEKKGSVPSEILSATPHPPTNINVKINFFLGEQMYYQRQDVRRAITDFANASGSNGVRECGFYNSKIKGVQRYLDDGDSQTPICLDRPSDMDRALTRGATAFYCSYWRYYLDDLVNPLGRDLVWTTRATNGGLKFAKEATSWVVGALEEAGVPEPWVKYSGGLGFDLAIPLETIPCEARASGVDVFQGLQEGLTSYIVSYLRERGIDVLVNGVSSPIELKRGKDTCLLSELRVKRGLLLAPMSLNPETGLVSVPVDPRKIESFTVLKASPEDARGTTWLPPVQESSELARQLRPWLPTSMSVSLPVF